jgi:hypothetical protein
LNIINLNEDIMNHNPLSYSEFEYTAKKLKESHPTLSDYEALSLAIQQQRNYILIAGLTVSDGNNTPSALESIAIQLGYKAGGQFNITDMLDDISAGINELKQDR